MPIFEIEAPDGRIFEVEGNAFPTEDELNSIFAGFDAPTPEIKIETELPKDFDLQATQELPEGLEPSPALSDTDIARFQTTQEMQPVFKEQAEKQAQAFETGEDLNLVDQALSTIFTKQTMAGLARGEQLPVFTAVFDAMGLPTRFLGYLAGKGDVSDADTGLLKDIRNEAKQSLDQLAKKPVEDMIGNLESKKSEIEAREDLSQEQKSKMMSILDKGLGELESQRAAGIKRVGAAATKIFIDLTTGIGEDPLAIAGAARGLGQGFKTSGDFAAEKAIKQAKIASKADVPEDVLVKSVEELGGPGEIAQRVMNDVFIDEKGKLGLNNASVDDALSKIFTVQDDVNVSRNFTRRKADELIQVPEFNNSDAIEATFNVNTDGVLQDAFGVIDADEFKSVVRKMREDLDDKERGLLLTALGLGDELSGEVSGQSVRKIIKNLNSMIDFTKDPRGLSGKLDKVRKELKNRLESAAETSLEPNTLGYYKELRRVGKGKQMRKAALLENIMGKGAGKKSTKMLNPNEYRDFNQSLRENLKRIGNDIVTEVDIDKTQLKELELFDRDHGTNLANLAQDFAFAKRLGIFPSQGELTKIRKLGKTAKATSQQVDLTPSFLSTNTGTLTLQGLSFLKKISKRNKELQKAVKAIQKLDNKDPLKRLRLSKALVKAGISQELVNQVFPTE